MNPKSLFAFVLVSLLTVSMTVAAPADKKKEGKGGNPFAKLDLTKEQKQQIKEIQTAAKAKMKEAGDNKDAKKAIGKETKEKIMSVLTDEQKETLKKLTAAGKKDAPKKTKKKKTDNE